MDVSFEKIRDLDVEKLEFEDSVAYLEKIVAILGEGSLSLKQASDLYIKGIQLKSHCNKILKEIELKLNKISPEDLESATISNKEQEF